MLHCYKKLYQNGDKKKQEFSFNVHSYFRHVELAVLYELKFCVTTFIKLTPLALTLIPDKIEQKISLACCYNDL